MQGHFSVEPRVAYHNTLMKANPKRGALYKTIKTSQAEASFWLLQVNPESPKAILPESG